MSNHMDPIFSPNIAAYRKNHSCDTTLLRLVEEQKKELDCGKVTAVLSTDMSKAFDSIYSPLLVKKLEAYNFSTKALELMQAYFNQRKNRVKLGPVRHSGKNIYVDDHKDPVLAPLCGTFIKMISPTI